MTRLALLGAILAALAFAGCGETINPIVGSKPPQLLIWDDGDVDQHNIESACRQLGLKVARVQWVEEYGYAALVTCTD